MNMWRIHSVSHCTFLLTLAVLMFFSASQADSIVGLSCCRNVSTRKVARIKWCYEQKPREGCNRHAFLIATKRHKDKPWCINPNSKWLKDKIEKGELNCPQDLSLLNEVMQIPNKTTKS